MYPNFCNLPKHEIVQVLDKELRHHIFINVHRESHKDIYIPWSCNGIDEKDIYDKKYTTQNKKIAREMRLHIKKTLQRGENGHFKHKDALQ